MKVKVAVLAICMLLTGTINTIAVKYQDMTIVGYLPDGNPVHFQHPAVQSACMFFGELLCLVPYAYLRWRKRSLRIKAGAAGRPLVAKAFKFNRMLAFAIPALCDACATTLLNIGLFYTYASTYQMLRGTLVLFAGMFTILILRKRLHLHHWLGMVLITAGAMLVGAASVIDSFTEPKGGGNGLSLMGAMAQLRNVSSWGMNLPAMTGLPRGLLGVSEATDASNKAANPDGASAPLFGDLLVICAQMFAALQFILEEKFLVKYRVPALLAVGLEGMWGVILCVVILPITSQVTFSSGVVLDNALQAIQQIRGSMQLQISVCASIISIAFFNFFGISVTKNLSGASRATIDACRTLFIWLFSIAIGWEHFLALQVVGFLVLISGTSLYNEILKLWLPADDGSAAGEPGGYMPPPNAPDSSVTFTPSTMPRRSASKQQLSWAEDVSSGHGGAPGPSIPQAIAGRGDTAQLKRGHPSQDLGVSLGASLGDGYTMARSMRLGTGALSPHSLEEDEDMSEVGSSYVPTPLENVGIEAASRALDERCKRQKPSREGSPDSHSEF